MTEHEKFLFNPIEWCQEWNTLNGKIETKREEETGRFSVLLWVDGQTVPLSTGTAKTLDHAWKNAIEGMQRLAETLY